LPTSSEVEAALCAGGIIAIVRGNYPMARLRAIGEALREGGVGAVEVTLNSAAALEGVAALRASLDGQILVGAGTVRTVADVGAAVDAGAEFLVSPNFDPASVQRSRTAGVLHLPGVFTATEAQTAYAAGCRLVKLFPADLLGPAYLRALRAPLDDVGFVPTGGIDVGNIAEYVRAGAVAFGVGSALVRSDDNEPSALAARARALVEALHLARGKIR
jgi:2-dehydro-3-deoxyphosphogluconate aldolase / (4S)-4-hydroxy-2-oxoglutarate aldolase